MSRIHPAIALSNRITEGEKVTLDDCMTAVGDDGDTAIHLFMAMRCHITDLGYAMGFAREMLGRDPNDAPGRRIDLIINQLGFSVRVGSEVQQGVGQEYSRVIVACALSDWGFRVEGRDRNEGMDLSQETRRTAKWIGERSKYLTGGTA